jgi:hypothetical protein
MVHRALRNSTLLVGHTPGLAARLDLKPRAGLLYPGAAATLLDDLPPSERPEQLIVVDGTWHHAKTMVRDITALRGVPRYRLAPAEPSRYRIRREPSAMLLSTVEATVAALRALEPETRGLDHLLAAFNRMIERQLAHPKVENGWRRNAVRSRGGRNIPAALLGRLDQIVVAYGESMPKCGSKQTKPLPVYWAARRLGTDEHFVCAIEPQVSFNEDLLGHWELSQEDFAAALSLDQARAAWAAFHRPDDILVVYNSGTARLFRQIDGESARCLVLKSVDFNPRRRYRTLDELVAVEGLIITPWQHVGRAGRRVAGAAALVGHLRALAG